MPDVTSGVPPSVHVQHGSPSSKPLRWPSPSESKQQTSPHFPLVRQKQYREMTSKIDTLISQGTYGMGEDRLKKLMGETLRVELSRVHPVPPVPPTPGPVLPGNDEEQPDPNAVAQGGITTFMWADTDSKAKKYRAAQMRRPQFH